MSCITGNRYKYCENGIIAFCVSTLCVSDKLASRSVLGPQHEFSGMQWNTVKTCSRHIDCSSYTWIDSTQLTNALHDMAREMFQKAPRVSEKKTTANMQIQKMLLLKYKFLSIKKKYNRETLNTRLFILQIQLQRKPFACAYILIKPFACAYILIKPFACAYILIKPFACAYILIKPFACAYILIKPFMYRHYTTPPLQGSDGRNYAARHWETLNTRLFILQIQLQRKPFACAYILIKPFACAYILIKPFACAYILIKPFACAYILIKPFACAYILIKPFIHRHYTTPPLQGSDGRNYAATHWLQSFTKKAQHIASVWAT